MYIGRFEVFEDLKLFIVIYRDLERCLRVLSLGDGMCSDFRSILGDVIRRGEDPRENGGENSDGEDIRRGGKGGGEKNNGENSCDGE